MLPEIFQHNPSRQQQVNMIEIPVPVGIRSDGRLFVRIGTQVVEPRNPRLYERFTPDSQSTLFPLLGEHDLPVVVAQSGQIAIVGEIEKLLARTLGFLSGQIRKLIVAIQMNLVLLAARTVSLEQFLLDVGHARRRQQGGRPVEVGNDVVGHRSPV